MDQQPDTQPTGQTPDQSNFYSPQSAPDSPPPAETKLTGRLGSGLLAIVKAIFNWAVLPVAIVLILHSFVFQAFRVVGNSMVPTLKESDYLIISKVDASLARASFTGKSGEYIPQRNDVIVFRYPKNPELVFVKRVIALPGERVVIKNGKVTIHSPTQPDGLNPDEGHSLEGTFTMGEIDETVPKNNLFVLGDNRTLNGSFDSREWGFLPSEYVIGKAILRLLPLNTLKFFSDLEPLPAFSDYSRQLRPSSQ